ncbi:MAG: zinc-ribbon domain containing protein [Burkholderiales bacterium]|nr:zinc-ribbon domain containing protein [Burkholderiales bacterium]
MRKQPPAKERKRKPRVKSAAELELPRLRAQLKAAGMRAAGRTQVNASLLRPTNSYGTPDFVERGHYLDMPFRCKDCGKEEIWTATQQKWWYEQAQGDVWTVATRCRPCRRNERRRKAEAERTRQAGLALKAARQSRSPG